jgi:hypothetical protein
VETLSLWGHITGYLGEQHVARKLTREGKAEKAVSEKRPGLEIGVLSFEIL